MKLLHNLDCYHFISKYLPTSFLKPAYDFSAILSSFIITNYILFYPSASRLLLDSVAIFFITALISYAIGIHSHLWRFTSVHTILDTAKYSLATATIYLVWCFYNDGIHEIPFKFFICFSLISLVLLNLPRLMIRIAYERNNTLEHEEQVKVILIGAGKGGELFLREIKKTRNNAYHVQAVLDDNPELWGKKIFGVKVYGPIKDLSKVWSTDHIDMVIIAIPSLDKEKLIEITKVAEELNVPVRILPSFEKLLTSKQISPEDISVEDLLGRDSVNLENQEVLKLIKDKVVVVTGAGGSIGSEICRQLIKLHPKSLLLVDHSEYSLYKISWELENTYHYTNFIPVLLSITDKKNMDLMFDQYKPQIIFHAAAYKHVPLLETQVPQALQNNFFGTKVMAELADKYKCEKFILISTDKAVNPTNVMGSTKRMAEIFCQNLNEISSTSYITVRFGNVLDSAGSVIPLFRQQLQKGGPLTVTHPDITRFFMSIPEASQLVLQAGSIGEGGEIFVLDMGEPVKISDLAERLIILSGQRPYKDIDIVFTGLRPGEKLYEELFYENEVHIPTRRKKIFLAQSKLYDFPAFLKDVEILEESLEQNDIQKVVATILKMVPESRIKITAFQEKHDQQQACLH
jgi:FlaA1/EpsC-like NDP-sugar epimerase